MADSEKTWVFPVVINPLAAKTNSKTCQGGDQAAATPGMGLGTAPPGPPTPAAKPGSAMVIFLPSLKNELYVFAGTRGALQVTRMERKYAAG